MRCAYKKTFGVTGLVLALGLMPIAVFAQVAATGTPAVRAPGPTDQTRSSIDVRPPGTKARTQAPTTTSAGQETKSVTYPAGSLIPNQTCPEGFALKEVRYGAAEYSRSVCTATEWYPTGCDHACNAFDCFPASSCCRWTFGYGDNSCTDYESRCRTWGMAWTPSWLLLMGATDYMPTTYVCQKIVNTWTDAP